MALILRRLLTFPTLKSGDAEPHGEVRKPELCRPENPRAAWHVADLGLLRRIHRPENLLWPESSQDRRPGDRELLRPAGDHLLEIRPRSRRIQSSFWYSSSDLESILLNSIL